MLPSKMLRMGLLSSSLMVLGLALSGCAKQGGLAAASTAVDDMCRGQRLALDDSQEFFAGDIFLNALIGAAGGAPSGAVVGRSSRSIAPGARAGGGAGFA